MQTKIASRINTTFTLVANTLRFSLNLKALVQEQATIPQVIREQLIKLTKLTNLEMNTMNVHQLER